jgi:hypothetical protein
MINGISQQKRQSIADPALNLELVDYLPVATIKDT